MIVIDHLKRILDFSDEDLALSEANKKLNETVMWVNNRLEFVIKFNSDTLVIPGEFEHTILKKVEQLDVFLPEPGLYKAKDGSFLITVRKIAKKQWKKSFNFNYYVLSGDMHFSDYNLIDWNKTNIVLFDEKIYYKGIHIGHYYDTYNKCICNNNVFYQELSDYARSVGWTLIN